MGVVFLLCAMSWSARAELTGELKQFEERYLELSRQGKPSESRAAAHELLARALSLRGEDHDDTAAAIHYLAWATQYSDDFPASEKLWYRALAIDEKLHGKDTVQTARRLNMLGRFYREKGDFERAHEFFSRALLIREEHLGKSHVLTGNILYEFGRLCKLMGKLERAENYFQRVIPIFVNTDKEHYKTGELADAVLQLGEIYLLMGDPDNAERYALQALQIDQELHQKDPGRTSLSWDFDLLADIHEERGTLDQALKFRKESLDALKGRSGEGPALSEAIRSARQALGELYLSMRDWTNVESVLRPSLLAAIEDRALPWGNQHDALFSLAILEERTGEYEQAEKHARKVWELTENLPVATRGRIPALSALIRIQLARGKINDAVSLAAKLQDAEDQQFADILSFTSERQRLGWLKSFSRQRYSLWATSASVEPLGRAVLRTKGLVLDSLLEDRFMASQTDDPDAHALIDRVRLARQRVVGLNTALTSTSANSNLVARWTNELGRAVSEVEVAEAELARHVKELGHVRRALQTTIKEVQRAIPEDTAVLEMLRYRHYQGRGEWQDCYGVLVILREGEPQWVRLGAAEAIDRAVKIYQHMVRNAGDDGMLVGTLKELYLQLWAPVREGLPAMTTNIIISPDAQLNFVSFATLLQPNGRFIGEEFSLSYISTARDLLKDASSEKKEGSLAVWANPDFGGSMRTNARTSLVASRAATVREFRDIRLQPLKGAAREGRLLLEKGQRWGFTQVMLHVGADATEAALREIHSPRVLHLATHGFLLPDMIDARSSADFSTYSSLPRAVAFSNNPMLRSGFALAGAQRTIDAWSRGEHVTPEEDGIVTAEEVALLDLKNTWLVVVSACDTGGGEARTSEGVLGLRRGFIQAGAQNLLLTLWPIDDDQTADFILDFYDTANRARNAAQALARVQGKWLSQVRQQKGVGAGCRLAGPFILSFQGRVDHQ